MRALIRPQDEEREHRALRAEYGFSSDALRQQFLDTAADLVLELQSNAKQQNLIRFRSIVPPDLTMAEPLFVYDFGQVSTREICHLSQILLWPPAAAPHSLAPEIMKVCGAPWIVQYFVLSTFPAFFGHFFTDEYLMAGFNFIQSHINDDLAADLVGTFLFHAVLFRDRLFQAFWDRLSACQDPPDVAALARLLLASIRAAAAYLSAAREGGCAPPAGEGGPGRGGRGLPELPARSDRPAEAVAARVRDDAHMGPRRFAGGELRQLPDGLGCDARARASLQ
jgi:hypothetical protein